MKLNVSHLHVTLEKQPIVKDLQLEVAEGEFFSLLGPSGCGKSTLLKAIAGIHAPNSGRIFLGDQDITNVPPHKRGTVILFQDIRLFPNMSVGENVTFALKMQGISRSQREATASALLERVHLPGYSHRSVSELSGGEQQRVALARVLAAKPRILLLDEPFSALDENLRQEMRCLVKELHKEFHMTTLLVTHDRQEALSLSDRIGLLFDGQIRQVGTPAEVYRHPCSRQVADYFGGCTWLRGRVSGGQFRSGNILLPFTADDGAYTLGLRSDSWELHPQGTTEVTLTDLQFSGAETAAVFSLDGHRLQKRYDRAPELTLGASVRCRMIPERCLLFPEDSV